MKDEHYYHMFANGDDAKNFITSTSEFKAAFNRVGVCANLTGVTVVAFSIEDSHPHILLFGTYEACYEFLILYERMSVKSIVQHRGSMDGVKLVCSLEEVKDEQYLLKVGTYVINQPTKDGKAVMPYDYLYGTGPLYFRSKAVIMPWQINGDGAVSQPKRFDTLTFREKSVVCGTRRFIPDEWLVCNGYILPSNYVNVTMFENIYKTHNRFRVFLSGNKQKDEEVIAGMAAARGIVMEDIDARNLGEEVCRELFGKRTARHLDTIARLQLAQILRNKYKMAHRQISFLTRIPEGELGKYIK